MRFALLVAFMWLPIGIVTSCPGGGGGDCSDAACKKGVAAVQGGTCAFGAAAAGIGVAACGIGALFTLGISCAVGLAGTVAAGAACAPDWNDLCGDCPQVQAQDVLEKLNQQGVDLQNMNETLQRILSGTEKLDENDQKIMKILEDHDVALDQLQKYSEQIIDTLAQHGFKLDEIQTSVQKIQTDVVDLKDNDRKMLAILNENGITLEDLKTDQKKAERILLQNGYKIDHIITRLPLMRDQLDKLDKDNMKIIKALQDHNITLQELTTDTAKVIEMLKALDLDIKDLAKRVFDLSEQLDKLDENDMKILGELEDLDISVTKLMGFDIQILKEIKDQHVPLTNITQATVHIIGQLDNLNKSDQEIIKKLLKQDIVLAGINSSVIETVENTYKLMKGQGDIIKGIEKSHDLIEKLDKEMKEQFTEVKVLIQYIDYFNKIHDSRRMLEKLPTKNGTFQRFDVNDENNRTFQNFIDNVLGVHGHTPMHIWIDNLFVLLTGENGHDDDTRTLYQKMGKLCNKNKDPKTRENNYVFRTVVTGMQIYQIAVTMTGKEVPQSMINDWETKMAKSKQAFYQYCRCPLNTNLKKLSGIDKLRQMVNSARNTLTQNYADAGRLLDVSIREKAMNLLDAGLNIDINATGNIEILQSFWYEYTVLVAAINQQHKFPMSALNFEGVEVCVDVKKNGPAAGTLENCPDKNMVYEGKEAKPDLVIFIEEGQQEQAKASCGDMCWSLENCEFWSFFRLSTATKGTCRFLTSVTAKLEQDEAVWIAESGSKACSNQGMG